jgi:glycosyltransferase involved in cell wall biosynthesis
LIDKSDGIILHSAGQYPYLPQPLSKPVYIVPLRVDLSRYKPQYESGHERLRIVHAPTNRRFKGTDRILEALEQVKEDFELVLVEGKTPEEALKIYRTADIVIDQISGGSYGVFSIEAMALGKPVIAYISEQTRRRHPLLPVVSADFDSLAEVVSSLISDKQRRLSLGKSGRAYVERYHDHVRVTSILPALYAGKLKECNLFDLL